MPIIAMSSVLRLPSKSKCVNLPSFIVYCLVLASKKLCFWQSCCYLRSQLIFMCLRVCMYTCARVCVYVRLRIKLMRLAGKVLLIHTGVGTQLNR